MNHISQSDRFVTTVANETFCGENGFVLPYTQVFHHVPTLSPFYSNYEKGFNTAPIFLWMYNNDYVVPLISVAAYLAFCYYGQQIMASRKAFDLRYPLAWWNLFLSLFSTWGAIRTVPHLMYRIMNYTFEETVCEHVYSGFACGAAGFATQMFILSKIPELIDTVFIVLRKKPLIFLHWYHHVTVLIFCWNSYVTQASAGLYFVAMNYTVHAAMYGYFFLQAVKMVPKWFPSWIITLMQISQMIIGTAIVGASFYYYFVGGKKYAPGTCNNDPSNLAVGGIIYASYLYLFVEFAVKRFLFKGESKSKAKIA